MEINQNCCDSSYSCECWKIIIICIYIFDILPILQKCSNKILLKKNLNNFLYLIKTLSLIVKFFQTVNELILFFSNI